MHKLLSSFDVHNLLADAARALALMDCISSRDDAETLRLAADRATELHDELLQRRDGVRLSDLDAALFQGMMDRLKARRRFLRGKADGLHDT